MAQANHFIFTAGSGHVPPAQSQQYNSQMPSMQPQALPAPAQQAASLQSGQLPGLDMSALAGISPEQLAAIARLFQSGALQMPPPAPNAPAQTSPVAQPAPTIVQPSPSIPAALQHQSTATSRDDVDMDTEEGEVNESEEGNTPSKMRDFLRPPPTGPRKRSLSPREQVKNKLKERTSTRPPQSNSSLRKPSASQSSQADLNSAVTSETRAIAKDEEAKKFVLEMVKGGYSYEDIVPEIRNPKSLSRMFRELGLPVPSSHRNAPSTQRDGAVPAHGQAQVLTAKPDLVDETRKTSLNKPTSSAKPAPVDRSEYLARLQAAKNKKTETAASPSAPDSKPEPITRRDYLARLQAAKNKKAETVSAPSVPSTTLPAAVQEFISPVQDSKQVQSVESSGVTSSDGQAAPVGTSLSLTELARQKLNALKAQRAARESRNAEPSPLTNPAAASTNRQAISSPSQSGLGARLADIPFQVAHNATVSTTAAQTLRTDLPAPTEGRSTISPTPHTPRSFSSLPGLFMFDSLGQAPVSASLSQTQSSFPPLNQPVPTSSVPRAQFNPVSDGLSAAVGTPTAAPAPLALQRKRPVASDFDDTSARLGSMKRPFGQSRNASEDESLVIQVSDDEDEDDETEPEPIPGSSFNSGLQTKSFRDVGPLRDFPPKPHLVAQTSSPGTPGGVTYEQKIKEIEDFKRKIAEKENRRRANGKGGTLQSEGITGISEQPTTSIASDGGLDTMNLDNSTKLLAAETSSLINSSPQTVPQPDVSMHLRSVSADRPMSAVPLAKQRERERLRQRLLELEEEEAEGVIEAVEAAVAAEEPSHVMSGALPEGTPIQSSVELQTENLETVPETNVHDSASEEGELSDDSLSNFYDMQDGQIVRSQSIYAVEKNKTGSQATTVSTTSQPQKPSTDVPQVQESLSQHNGNAAVSSSTPTMTTAAEYLTSEVQREDVEVDENAPDHATTVVHDEGGGFESMEEDESDNESEDDEDDLDNMQEVPPGPQIASSGGSRDGSSSESDLTDGEPISHASFVESEIVEAEPTLTVSGAGPLETNDDINDITVDDDLAPELQPSSDQEALVPDETPAKPKSYFTPYRSPLVGFKDYRYHPEYLNTVSGGYKSATYSNNIDPEIALCPFETAGGKCNDEHCQFQHWKTMVVSDNELLKTMGTKDIPTHEPEELKRWNDGLSAVVRGLRNTNLAKNSDAIAARIAEFRKDFLGDPTKVLNLG